MIRLHLSENAYGPSERAAAAVREELERSHVYPDPDRRELVDALAAHHGVRPEQVLVANGSDELVLLTALALCPPGGTGLTTAATFPGYRICLLTAGREVVETASYEEFVDALDGTSIGYLCNPHNPTGAALTSAELDHAVAAADSAGVPLVVDEAYAEFRSPWVPDLLRHVRAGADVLALRTFSKAYGIAGHRIGYALAGRPERIEALRRAQGAVPFSVNRFGLVAALAALADQEHLARVVAANRRRREDFRSALASAGWATGPSETNFVLVPVGDSAAVERELAAAHGILVRDAGRFGLPGHVRVSVGSGADLAAFLIALAAVDRPVLKEAS